MSKFIVIDDERTFDGYLSDATYVRNSNDALAMLAKIWTNQLINYEIPIEELWLDHDLGKDDTIMPVVDFLYVMGAHKAPLQVNKIIVHTMNPVGDRIVRLLITHYSTYRSALPTIAAGKAK